MTSDRVSDERLAEIIATAGVQYMMIPVEEGFSILTELQQRRSVTVCDEMVERAGIAIGKGLGFNPTQAFVEHKDLARSALTAALVPAEQEGEKLGRFDHHPDPAIDFEIEVQSLEARLFNAKGRISKPGTEPEAISAVLADIERAMSFRVGGDPSAVSAKQTLRALETEAKQAIAPTTSGDNRVVRYAVQSVTGSHIGMWNDEDIARKVFREDYPDGEMLCLVPLSSLEAAERERDELTSRNAVLAADGIAARKAAANNFARAETAEASLAAALEDIAAMAERRASEWKRQAGKLALREFAQEVRALAGSKGE